MRQFLLAAAVGFITARTSLAYRPIPPHSYSLITPGGQYVFVMIAPEANDLYGISKGDTVAAETRRKWPQSGMYRNDGSRVPLWTVDWYAHSGQLRLASDGVHVVRIHGVVPTTDPDSDVLFFFASGQPVRTYSVRRLASASEHDLPTLAFGGWLKSDAFDDAGMTLRFETTAGDHFTLDVRTGEILDHSRDLPRWLVIGLCALAALGGVILLALVVRQWTHPRPGERVSR